MTSVDFATEKWAFAELNSVMSLEMDCELVLSEMVKHVSKMKIAISFVNESAFSAVLARRQVAVFERRFEYDLNFVTKAVLVVWEHV